MKSLSSSYDVVTRSGTESFKKVGFIILGYVYCIGFSIFLALSIPIYVFRQIIILCSKHFKPELGEIISGQSALYVEDLFSKKPPRGNIIVCMTATGSPCKEDLKENMMMKNWINATDKITGDLKYKKFQQYPVRWMGFYFWAKNADGKFDPDNHFHFHENLGNEIVTDEDVTLFTEKLLNAPFKRGTSPWELHLVHNYRSEQLYPNQQMSQFILKVHHSLADGYSILSAIVEGLCETPLANIPMPVAQFTERSTIQKLKYAFTLPFMAFHELSYGLSHEFKSSPWKIPDEKKAWYQFCAKSDLIPIQKIKKIKNALGVSFTSVLLSAISAAIHKNLEIKKKGGEIKSEDDKGSLYFLSTLPVPGHNFNLTNYSTAAFFDIPTSRFPSPIQRLHALEAVINKTKNSIIPYVVRFYFKAVGCHLASVCSRVSKNRGVSAGLTNFPSLPIHIQRKENVAVSVDFSSGALAGSAGVGISVLSYGQYIRVNVTAEKGLMSREETNQLTKDILDEIELFHEQAFNKSSSQL